MILFLPKFPGGIAAGELFCYNDRDTSEERM